ncbi:MAG TPA: hypothetical protein DEG69_02260 [Flavobacteriaceae bacterium]|nr:hypothetical protein [Flavobacteriaceae bacterium]
MKTSLVIPCSPEHFVNTLPSVLRTYEGGTVKPDEVVVSLSQAPLLQKMKVKQEDSAYISQCISGNIFDKFKILNHNTRQTHGPNRQEGSLASTGDIIIYSDADDVAHRQRIEIIKYFFENYDIAHLNHRWIGDKEGFRDIDLGEIKYVNSQDMYKNYFPNQNIKECLNATRAYGGGFMTYTHTGHTSISREGLQKVRWKDWGELWSPAEDYEFCMETLYSFNKSMLIKVPLIEYSNAGHMAGNSGDYYG